MMKEQQTDIESNSSQDNTESLAMGSFRQKPGDNSLRWNGVHMSVKTKDSSKTILDNVWGEARPFETTAIMGASGAGKTSLFSLLAGRLQKSNNMTVKGDIRVGGTQITDANINQMRKKFAFVGQEDTLHATSTPREAIRFSARLRLPREVSDEEIDRLVETYIQELGLSNAADTQIGGLLSKGISGGEKRRTSVGVELVTNPSIILLDEPTSGLDSHAAASIMELLRKVALRGNTVLFTVHQPSSKLFFSFDRLILLNSGRLMHTGKTTEVPSDFKQLGCPVPENTNPADWILEVSEDQSMEKLEEKGFFPKSQSSPEVVDLSCELNTEEENSDPSNPSDQLYLSSATLTTQAKLLFEREWTNFKRSSTLVLMTIAIACIMITIAGTLFFGIGKSDRSEAGVISGVFGAMVQSLVLSMMMPAGMVVAWYASERPLFVKEYQTRTYKVLPYLIAKFLFDTLQTTIIAFCISLISYYMAGFRMNFGVWLGINCQLAWTVTAMATAFGVSFSDTQLASLGLNLISIPQFYFSGLLVPVALIPTWIRWLQYFCAMRYSTGLSSLYEFNQCTAEEEATCQLTQETNSVNDSIWWFWLANFGLLVVMRVLSYFLLKRSISK